MDEQRWTRVKDIFSGVVDLDPGTRLGKLDELCGNDRKLRGEVSALLRSNDEIDDFIERPAFTVADAFPIDHETAPNKTIGRYRIVREIGRGGMGAVFLATRDDGEFEQQVAIKVVSSAFLGRESLRRFRQERQILAR
jgi:eukaryotic-like serine/threonine-protein kinase